MVFNGFFEEESNAVKLGYRLAEKNWKWKHCEGERNIAREISYTLPPIILRSRRG
jgi:hypothetical protein